MTPLILFLRVLLNSPHAIFFVVASLYVLTLLAAVVIALAYLKVVDLKFYYARVVLKNK
jgi:hypothetical protein